MKLHHTGFVVADMAKYAKNHPLGECIAEVEDPLQNAKLAIFKNHSEILTELIQPLGESAFTWNALKKNGNHFHHFCYIVNKLHQAEAIADEFRMLRVLGPIPAVLFGSLEVVFYYSRNQQIVEFIVDPNFKL